MLMGAVNYNYAVPNVLAKSRYNSKKKLMRFALFIYLFFFQGKEGTLRGVKPATELAHAKPLKFQIIKITVACKHIQS